MIIREEKEWAICQDCGLMIRRSASEDGRSTFIHHMPQVLASVAGQQKLIAYYEKCPSLGQRLDV